MKIRFNHWWFKLFPGGGVVLWPYVLFKRPPHEVSARLFRHELQHVYQIERHGPVKFYLKYLWYTLRHGYTNNPFEVHARDAEDSLWTSGEREAYNAAAEFYYN